MKSATESRRRLVRKTIISEEISSQAQLKSILAGAGFEVTQATVSRDLDAVGARKIPNGRGGAAYELVSGNRDLSAARRALAHAIAEFVRAIVPAGNMVVVKVPPGAAQLVAGRIDAAGIEGVLGTVAGDDTLLIVVRENGAAIELARELEELGAEG